MLSSVQGILSPCSQELVHGARELDKKSGEGKVVPKRNSNSMSSDRLPVLPSKGQIHFQCVGEGYKQCSRALRGGSRTEVAANAALGLAEAEAAVTTLPAVAQGAFLFLSHFFS